MSTNDPATTASGFPFPATSFSSQPATLNTNSTLANSTPADATSPKNDAASLLGDAIDDFLGDLEKKFKSVSDEILTKLDDMAERCDRIEAELLMRDAAGSGTSKSSLEEKRED